MHPPALLRASFPRREMQASRPAAFCAFPVRFPQPSVRGLLQTTRSLDLSNQPASSQVPTVITASAEITNIFYEDTEYVPVADAPSSNLQLL